MDGEQNKSMREISKMSLDAFDQLGLSPSFVLDLPLVRQKYLALQRATHPDLVGVLLQDSTYVSSDINVAYKKLLDPLERAKMILVRIGGNPDAPPSEDFLEMVLEWGDPSFTSDIARELWNETLSVFQTSYEAKDKNSMQMSFWILLYLKRHLHD